MLINMEREAHIYCNSDDHSTIEGTFKINSHPFFEITSEENDYRRRRVVRRKITVTRDPVSHRVIEKRRRDRMNACLSSLCRLIPIDHLKKGRGRVEKAEIVEMAIEHMQHLQKMTATDDQNNSSDGIQSSTASSTEVPIERQYKLGYHECAAEAVRFLERQGFLRSGSLCVRLFAHLQRHYEKLAEGNTSISNLMGNESSPENAFKDESTNRENGFHENNGQNGDKVSGFMNLEHPMSHRERSASLGYSSTRASSPDNGKDSNQIHAGILFRHCADSSNTSNDRSEDEKWTKELLPFSNGLDNAAHSSNGSLFKFKTLIRERFEQATTKRSLFLENGCNAKEHIRHFSSFSQFPSLNNHKHEYQEESQSVPVFVLSSQGSFYVPSTIDSNLIAALFPELRENTGGVCSLSLHPVTISVNFNHSCPSCFLERHTLLDSLPIAK